MDLREFTHCSHIRMAIIVSAILFALISSGCLNIQEIELINSKVEGKVKQTQTVSVPVNLVLDPTVIEKLFGTVDTPFNPTAEQLENVLAEMPEDSSEGELKSNLEGCLENLDNSQECEISTE